MARSAADRNFLPWKNIYGQHIWNGKCFAAVGREFLLHNVVAKFVKMDGEEEDYLVYGDTLMYGGIKLKQSFGGTGYDKEMRFFPDFASRMYFMEAE